MTIPSIETQYAGCRFRSRIEARWAVYLDIVGVKWEYEPEGFKTPAGWYLPDFRVGESGDMYPGGWVEIKGSSVVSDYDLDRCKCLGAIILTGDIPRTEQEFTWLSYENRVDGSGEWVRWRQDEAYPPFKVHQHALDVARSARFEYGETGR